MVLSEKMRVFELASSSFFTCFFTIFLLCYFELFPVTGVGINLFLPLRTRESDCCIVLRFRRFSNYPPVRKNRIFHFKSAKYYDILKQGECLIEGGDIQ